MSNRRGRGAPEGEQPEIVSAHCWHRGEETEGERRWGRPAREPCSQLAKEAQLAASTPGSATRRREEDPHLRVALSSVLSFFFSFIERGLRFTRNNSHYCAEQAPCSRAESPAEACVLPTLRPCSHAACVLRGFSFKENVVFGVFCLFLKILSKEY